MTRWMFLLGLVRCRYGSLHWVSFALICAGAALHGYLTPTAERLLAQQAVSRAKDIAAATVSRDAELARQGRNAADAQVLRQRLDAFQAVLMTQQDMTAVQARLLQLADDRRLTVGFADYRTIDVAQAAASAVEIRMPVRGSYPQLRGFVEEALQGMPALALRDLRMRRTSVVDEQLEAQLVWIVFFRKGPV